jgi:ankyrin repeat protein
VPSFFGRRSFCHFFVTTLLYEKTDLFASAPDVRKALANVQDRKNGNRPLHIAAQNGHLELVKFLVGAGADVNAQNAGGQTAMHMATSYDIDAVVKVLNDAGADGSIVNGDGYAAKWGLAGEKDPTSANYFVEQFQGASDEATLARCLDELLKKAEAGEVDKQKFPAIGLKVKKANAASGAWTPAVQAKFVAVVQAEPAREEPPSFG